MSSNGLSSGNHPLEATVHALCEVIERDSHSLWSLGNEEEKQRTILDLASVDDEACRHVLSLLERAGVGVIAWDMTSDNGIPAYSAQIMERPDQARWRTIGPAGGYGCHLSPAVALMRALTEAVQSRLTIISGSRDDRFYRAYDSFGSRDNVERAWKALAKVSGGVAFAGRARLDTRTFEEDVGALVARLRGVGIKSAVVVDLARGDLGIPVVKVIVPGLEGHCESATYRPGARAAGRVTREAKSG